MSKSEKYLLVMSYHCVFTFQHRRLIYSSKTVLIHHFFCTYTVKDLSVEHATIAKCCVLLLNTEKYHCDTELLTGSCEFLPGINGIFSWTHAVVNHEEMPHFLFLLTEAFNTPSSLNRKVHLLGSFQNIKMARTAICNLILGKKDSFYIWLIQYNKGWCHIWNRTLWIHMQCWEVTFKPLLLQQEVPLQRSMATSGWWLAGLRRDSEALLTAVCIYPFPPLAGGIPTLICVNELRLLTPFWTDTSGYGFMF